MHGHYMSSWGLMQWKLLEITYKEDSNLPISDNQCHTCWCSGYAKVHISKCRIGILFRVFNDKLLPLFINNFEAEEDDIIQNKCRDLATYREISAVNIYSWDSERLGNNEIIQFKLTGGKINFSFRCELAPGLMSESLSKESQHWFR